MGCNDDDLVDGVNVCYSPHVDTPNSNPTQSSNPSLIPTKSPDPSVNPTASPNPSLNPTESPNPSTIPTDERVSVTGIPTGSPFPNNRQTVPPTPDRSSKQNESPIDDNILSVSPAAVEQQTSSPTFQPTENLSSVTSIPTFSPHTRSRETIQPSPNPTNGAETIPVPTTGLVASQSPSTFSGQPSLTSMWETILEEGFENDLIQFESGGRYNAIADVGVESAIGPSHSIMIRYQSEKSVATLSKQYDVTKYAKIRLKFQFQSEKVRVGDFFAVEMSANGSDSFTILKTFSFLSHEWNMNGKWIEAGVEYILQPGHEFIRLRFRSNLNGIRRKIFFDQILLAGWIGD